ncbi:MULTISPECIES: JAB domain-containing protein [unclassified Streptomyces]
MTSGGASFGVEHNHPTGDPTPRTSDRRLATRLRERAAAVELRFLD